MAAPNALLNTPAGRIERLGFRKWYERELLSGHAHMVLCVLSVVALMASMESLHDGASMRLENVFFVFISGAIGLWALRRYLFLMMRAEVVAHQAVCPDCGTYGLFGVVAHHPGRGEAEVCCRHCSRRWMINTDS